MDKESREKLLQALREELEKPKTKEEAFQHLVDLGIYNSDGSLSVNYGGEISIEDKFIAFLEGAGIRNRFIDNMINWGDMSWSELISTEHPDEYIINAFCWDNTPEGEDFWGEYDGNWSDLCMGSDEELPVVNETMEYDLPEYHYEGMGCGLEDNKITDRYEACEYGWNCAVEACDEDVIKPLREELERLKKCLDQSGEWSIVNCCMCDNEFVFYPEMCCSGTECGCMGMPTSPQVCSGKCYNDMIEKTRNY